MNLFDITLIFDLRAHSFRGMRKCFNFECFTLLQIISPEYYLVIYIGGGKEIL